MDSIPHSAADEQEKNLLTSTIANTGETPRKMKEWRSSKIKPAYTGFMALFGTLIVVVIIYLAASSQRNDGFVTIIVKDQPISGSIFDNYVFDKGLLWTSLPSLIVTLYNLAWGSLATAAIDRQPFVDLMVKKKVIADRSIALDYRTELPVWNCIVALKNNHFLISGLMATALIMSLMSSAAAHLFVLKPIVSRDEINLAVKTVFNSSALTTSTDLRRTLDLVVATRIYGASPPPWNDGEYAFPTVSLPSSSDGLNFTVSIEAQAAYLICEIIDSSEYQSTLGEVASNANYSKLTIKSNDRGCSIDPVLIISPDTPNYPRTFTEFNCSSDVSSRRFGMISGIYSASSPTLLRNLSVISCIPQYWTHPGRIELITLPTKQAPIVSSFTRDATGATQLGLNDARLGKLFENGLDLTDALDATNTIATTEFGRILLQQARSRSDSPMDANVLQDAMSETFTSAFAMLSSTTMFTSINDGSTPTVSVSVAKTTQRLLVYLPIAGLVCAVIAFSVLCTLAVMVYTKTHPSVLREEPSGLLSYADILFGSNIFDVVGQVRAHAKYDGRIVQRAKKYFEFDKVECSTTGTEEHLEILVGDMESKRPKEDSSTRRRKAPLTLP